MTDDPISRNSGWGSYRWPASYMDNPTEVTVFWYVFWSWTKIQLACCFLLYTIPLIFLQFDFQSPKINSIADSIYSFLIALTTSVLFTFFTTFILSFAMTDLVQIGNRFCKSAIPPPVAGLIVNAGLPIPAVAFNSPYYWGPTSTPFFHGTFLAVVIIQTACYLATILCSWWQIAEPSKSPIRFQLSTLIKGVIPTSFLLLLSSYSRLTFFLVCEVTASVIVAFLLAYLIDFLRHRWQKTDVH